MNYSALLKFRALLLLVSGFYICPAFIVSAAFMPQDYFVTNGTAQTEAQATRLIKRTNTTQAKQANTYCAGGNQFCVSWTVDKTAATISFIISGYTGSGGYLAFGFSDGTKPKPLGDIYVGWVTSSGAVMLTDRYMKPHSSSGVVSDSSQDLTAINGSTKNGVTTISFKRKLNTGDAKDTVISLTQTQEIMWATLSDSSRMATQQNKNAPVPVHNKEGFALINFGTGATENGSIGGESFIPPLTVGLYLVAIIVFGLVMRKWDPVSLNHKPIGVILFGPKLNTRLQSFYTPLDTLKSALEMSINEILAVGGFIVMLVVVFITDQNEKGGGEEAAALAWGALTQIAMLFTLLPLPLRSSFLLVVLNCSFDRAVKYHRWVGRLLVLFALIHGIMMWQIRGTKDVFSAEENSAGMGNLYGTISVIAMIIILVTSIAPVRRLLFEFFMYIHIIGFVLAVVMAILHAKSAFAYVAAPLILWVIDFIIKLYYRYAHAVEVVSATPLPEQVVRLDIRLKSGKVFKYKPGQYVYLAVENVSKLQFHPFTIAFSNTQLKTFTLLIKGGKNDSWASEVMDVVRRTDPMKLNVRVDGPIGKVGVNLHNASVLVLVAGGIGITPTSAIIDDICKRYPSSDRLLSSKDSGYEKLKRVYIIWSTKQATTFVTWLPDLRTSSPQILSLFDVHLFATKSKPLDLKQIPSTPVSPGRRMDVPSRSASRRGERGTGRVDTAIEMSAPVVSSRKSSMYRQQDSAHSRSGARHGNEIPIIDARTCNSGRGVQYSRPNIATLFSSINSQIAAQGLLRGRDGSTGDVTCVYCGPDALSVSVVSEATERGWKMHREMFG